MNSGEVESTLGRLMVFNRPGVAGAVQKTPS